MTYRDDPNSDSRDVPYILEQPIYDIIDTENKETYNYRNLKKLASDIKLNQYIALKGGSTTVSDLPEYIPEDDSTLKILPEYTVLRPFYTSEYLNRLSNAYLFDDVIQSCMERLSQFTLGTSDDFRSVLYPDTVRALKSELEAKNELMQIKVVKTGLDIAGSIVSNYLTEQEISDFEKFVHYVDKISKLGQHLKKNFRSSHVFGRSCSYIEFTKKEIPELGIPIGCPIALKPIKPMFLGNVVVDGNTWQIKALELRDPKLDFAIYEDQTIQDALRSGMVDQNSLDSGRYIDINHVLYFVRNNNNTMLYDDDFWFGHSTLQSILSLSEENRRLNQIVIPALNQAHWAGTGIWHFPNWSARQMKSFLDKIKPGGHIAVPQAAITFQETKLSYDYDGILKLKDEIKKSMLSVFGIPSFLMNFEDITNRACYSEDTQTLTEDGWKYYWEIDETKDKIATFNPETEELEYHLPIAKYVYDNKNKEMIHFHSQVQDIYVTPEHMMWYKGSENGQWIKRQAKELMNLSQVYFRSHIKPSLQNEEICILQIPMITYNSYNTRLQTTQVKSVHMDTFLEFLGYYLSEGTRTYNDESVYHIALSQNIDCNIHKACKIQFCLDKLEETGFKFSSYIDNKNIKRWQLDNKQLHNFLSLETGGNHHTKHIPRWVLSKCSTRQLQILLDALILGDGTYDNRPNRTNKSYYTTSKQLADDVQEIALRLGLYSQIKTYDDKRPLKDGKSFRKRIYRVMISKTNNHIIHKMDKIENYEGNKVYCFEVPNHLFITRRNGKVAIQGNTAEMVVVGFNESTIQAERSWIRDILDAQWYSQLLKSYYPADEFIHIKLKIISEFDNISFESFMEKAVALSSLIDKNVVTITEARDIMNLPPLTLQGYQELGITPPSNILSATQPGTVPGVNTVTSQPNGVPSLKDWLANKQQDPNFQKTVESDNKQNSQIAQKIIAGKL